MKKTTVFIFSLLLLIIIVNTSAFAQVNCDLTLETTIQGFDVYKHNPTGAILYKAKMYIDADGSPRAYGPNNSGLDYTANAGSPGNWWGIATDNNGNPIIQSSGDPYPGMYVATTSLVNSAYSSSNPLRYVNSETIPFFVLPTAVVSLGGIHIGDIGYVYNTSTGQGCYAIYADSGPAGSLGEGSIYLATQIGVNPNARTGGTSQAIIDYIIFPNSGSGQGTIPTTTQINNIGTTQIATVGGTGITACLSPGSCGTPANLVVNSITSSTATLNWDAVSGANSYNVQYKVSNSSNWITLSTTATSVSINGLNGATGYQFQVQAVCTSAGNYSSPTSFTTSESIIPTTAISVLNNWETANFTATFVDADNTGGSGIEKSYYQVLDYNGTEWHANATNGFFADNFDSYNTSVWSVPAGSGTWQVMGGNLIQSDSSVNNSNIYASLNQNLSNRYLYQFYAMIDAATYSGNQHRFGFHFFSDDATQTNRGNSYFVYFRQETSVMEFYKVVNNTFTLMKAVGSVTTTFGQWNDYKIIFDRTTGKIDVYKDDVLLGSYTDSNVLTNQGNYISFRTGDCKAYISELKVYRSRLPSVTVTVGAAATNDIRYQNPDSITYSGKIKSIVNDAAGNLSTIVSQNIYVDWTSPSCVTVNDGSGNDIDTISSLNTLSANWTASSDANSGISKYWYAIGTTSGATDIVNWTDNNLSTSVNHSGLSLIQGQHYYFSIKALDGAGLNSICSSDGVIVDATTTGIIENENTISISVQPNPFNESAIVFFSQKTEQRLIITLTDVLGKQIQIANASYSAGIHSVEINADGLQLSKGLYTFRISSDKSTSTLRLIKD